MTLCATVPNLTTSFILPLKIPIPQISRLASGHLSLRCSQGDAIFCRKLVKYDVLSFEQRTQKLGASLVAGIISISVAVFGTQEVSSAQMLDNQQGKAIFQKACIGCHYEGGNILQPGATLTARDLERNGVATEENIFKITYYGKGRMPIFMQICAGKCVTQPWIYWNFFEEADFGPGLPIHTVFFIAHIKADEFILSEESKWLTFSDAWRLLVDVNPRHDRLGPLAAFVSSSYFGESLKSKFNIKSQCQEYPPGVLTVPMSSLTLKPFKKTNLVVFAPDNCSVIGDHDSNFAAHADALIMDPGCHYSVHDQLAEIVTSLPRKLVIFVTHHHRDHVDGLSVVQRCNPNVTLLAHEATIRRIAKGAKGIKCINVQGGSTLCIGGQEFQVIFAPGHTDGHMALLHVRTHTLVVGDHCVGQGSSFLDVTSGGNMKDYLETTHKFLELSPHIIVPMHGRPSLWPTNLLCGYIKHRKERETKVLKAIESGAETLYEVVSKAYTDVLPFMWMGASSNVRLHVEHLAYQKKLPADFPMDTFLTSCGHRFLLRWLWAMMQNTAQTNSYLNYAVKLSPVLMIGLASSIYIYFSKKQKL